MPEALRMVPENVAGASTQYPFRFEDGQHPAGRHVRPPGIIAQDEIRHAHGHGYQSRHRLAVGIERNLERLYSIQESMEDASLELMDTAVGDIDLTQAMEKPTRRRAVIQLVNRSSSRQVREGPPTSTSSLREEHPGAVPHRRQLFNAFDFPKHLHPAVSSRMKIMSAMDISEKRRPRDGRILIKVLGRRVDLRVSSCLPSMVRDRYPYPRPGQRHGRPHQARLDADDKLLVDQVCNAPTHRPRHGPHRKRKIHHPLLGPRTDQQAGSLTVVTVEDPVEYTIFGIGQVQVNDRAGLNFNNTLAPSSARTRQDHGGEIRDGETAQLAIRAALTGHLVLSTLHTNDAPSAAIRLIDMGIQPFLVSSSLLTVIAQRLVRSLCSACKENTNCPKKSPKPGRPCRDQGIPPGGVQRMPGHGIPRRPPYSRSWP